jgi:hypothetical protein
MYLLGGVGLTIILTMAHICECVRRALPAPIGFRNLPEGGKCLLGCPLCTGTWVGWAVGSYAWWRGVIAISDVVLFGFAVAVASYFAGVWFHHNDVPLHQGKRE